VKPRGGKRRRSRSRGPRFRFRRLATRGASPARGPPRGDRATGLHFSGPLTRRAAGTGPRAGVKFAAGPRARREPPVSGSGPGGHHVPARTPSFRSWSGRDAPSRVGRRRLRPVLKHGPRSLTRERVVGHTKPVGAVKAKAAFAAEGRSPQGAQSRRFASTSHRAEQPELARWDPKDGELCLARSKPGETLVEDRSDSDVQIDRRSWV